MPLIRLLIKERGHRTQQHEKAVSKLLMVFKKIIYLPPNATWHSFSNSRWESGNHWRTKERNRSGAAFR